MVYSDVGAHVFISLFSCGLWAGFRSGSCVDSGLAGGDSGVYVLINFLMSTLIGVFDLSMVFVIFFSDV